MQLLGLDILNRSPVSEQIVWPAAGRPPPSIGCVRMTANFIRALAVKSFDVPDRKRCPDKAEFDLVTVDDYSVARLILAPGWRWSESAKPAELTTFCEHHHLGYCVSGQLEIETAEGARSMIHANDTYALPPGHDEWVVGDEPFVAVEFLGAASFGRPRSHGMHALI